MNDESTTTDESCNLANAGQKLQGTFNSATDYLRQNPWIGVAAGVLVGAAVFACAKSSKPEPTNLEKLREILDDMYAKLPSKKEAKSAVNCLLNKLHIPA